MSAGQFANDFDGSVDGYLRNAALTGATDAKVGTASVWLRLDGNDGVQRNILVEVGDDFQFLIRDTNSLRLRAKNAATANIFIVDSTETFTASTTWKNVLCSWDLATATVHLYINDVAGTFSAGTRVDDLIDYENNQWAFAQSTGGAVRWNGAISEFWFTNTYLDFSVEANRRKFIGADSKPVPLGPTGSFPTGTAPLIYAPDGDPTDNKGTGGNFTKAGAPVRVVGPGRKPLQAALIQHVVR